MKTICILVMALLLNGCSVGMALSGKPDANLSFLDIGKSRDIVILNLGSPTESLTTAEGRTDIYHLERGNSPNAGRAAAHAIMDVVTLGIWEAVGTPIEGLTGEEYKLTVDYDKNNKVIKVFTH